MASKRILVLGSTGSIGTQTLDVLGRHPEKFEVVGLAAGSNAQMLLEQAERYGVDMLGLADAAAANAVGQRMSDASVFVGARGLVDMVDACGPDLVIGAISGFDGLPSTLAALEAGIDVALANKEPLVAAGELVMEASRSGGGQLIPIDSELSAIFQCMRGEDRANISRILLTASGGPFSKLVPEELASVTAEQALAHPTWRMGKKVTIDSATLANKGFEVFELKWLFDVSFDQIEVVVHHQSIIHSLVEFRDRSVIAQVGWPDMRVAIQFAMTWPERMDLDLRPLDLVEAGPLTFARPDIDNFPCLKLAFDAGHAGGGYPAVLVGADQAAVDLFLDARIGFTDIPRLIGEALDEFAGTVPGSLDDVVSVNEWGYEYVRSNA
jgi:1-deoxy-D-xylulose-5-phosphate reductoisomerase